MHQSFPAAPSNPGLLGSICPPCQSQGWGIYKFCAAWRPGVCQPRGHSRALNTYVVSYQNTTQRILLGKKIIGSSSKDRKKMKRVTVVKACSWFYACIPALLIKPELYSELGSYRRESTIFGYWIKSLLILFEEHPFIFIKLIMAELSRARSVRLRSTIGK